VQVPLKANPEPGTTGVAPNDGSLAGGTNVTLSIYGHVQPDQYEACDCYMYIYMEPVATASGLSDRCARAIRLSPDAGLLC
jgi:hypothetical protein